jgi:hypothetical protein
VDELSFDYVSKGNGATVMRVCKRLQIVCAVAAYLTIALGFSLSAYAKLDIEIESGIKPGEDWITAKNWCQFAEDAFIAEVSDEGKLLASIEYCATYGESDASAFTDKGGRRYVLIERNTQRGTHATWRDLDIYRIVPGYYDGYDKIMVIPIQEPSGTCRDVRYEYAVTDSPNGGLQLTFAQKLIGDCDGIPLNPLMPDKARTVIIDMPK